MERRAITALNDALEVDFGEFAVVENDVSAEDMEEYELRIQDSVDAQAEALAGLQDLSAG